MINYFYLFAQTPLKRLMRVDKPHKLKISQFKRDPKRIHKDVRLLIIV